MKTYEKLFGLDNWHYITFVEPHLNDSTHPLHILKDLIVEHYNVNVDQILTEGNQTCFIHNKNTTGKGISLIEIQEKWNQNDNILSIERIYNSWSSLGELIRVKFITDDPDTLAEKYNIAVHEMIPKKMKISIKDLPSNGVYMDPNTSKKIQNLLEEHII